jgi:copper(I)-binding protein
MRRATTWISVTLAMAAALPAGTPRAAAAGAAAQRKQVSVASAWVKLPAAGASATEAYATIENPTMYDFYVKTAASDAAGSVELRQTGKEAALDNVAIAAYETLAMDAKGVHLLLKELKKPLAEGDKVELTLVNEAGVTLTVQATVRKD